MIRRLGLDPGTFLVLVAAACIVFTAALIGGGR